MTLPSRVAPRVKRAMTLYQTPACGSCSCFVTRLWFQSWCKKGGRSSGMWENSSSFQSTLWNYIRKKKKPRQAKLLEPDSDTVEKTKMTPFVQMIQLYGDRGTKRMWRHTSHHITLLCESVAAEQSVYCQGPMRAQSLWSHSGPLGWHIFNIFQKRDTRVQQTTSDFFHWESQMSLWIIAKSWWISSSRSFGGSATERVQTHQYFRKIPVKI